MPVYSFFLMHVVSMHSTQGYVAHDRTDDILCTRLDICEGFFGFVLRLGLAGLGMYAVGF